MKISQINDAYGTTYGCLEKQEINIQKLFRYFIKLEQYTSSIKKDEREKAVLHTRQTIKTLIDTAVANRNNCPYLVCCTCPINLMVKAIQDIIEGY